MTGDCTICAHSDVEGINLALSKGTARKVIAQTYGVGEGSLQRHKQHAKKQAAKRKPAGITLPKEPSLTQLASLKAEAQRIIDETEDEKTRIAALREMRGYIELEVRLDQEAQGPSSLVSDPAFQGVVAWVVTAINKALADFPEARAALDKELGRSPEKSLLMRLTCERCHTPMTSEPQQEAT